MDRERYQRLKAILLEAEALDGPGREEHLRRVCAGDPELHAEALSYLDARAVATEDVAPPLPEGFLPEERPPERIGAYRILSELGRGGMGIVYEAIDTRSGERVALKAIYPHFIGNARVEERFAREARSGAQVVHENVVRTLRAERVETPSGPHHVMAMEFVEGRTLAELRRSLGRVPESLLRQIALDIARGLAAIHELGIVHRDIKPANVIMTVDERVRIMDLGIARILEASADLTREGDFVGSLSYAAPEQCEGQPVSPRADLYSLGVVLYELAAGVNPFDRESPAATLSAQLEFEPEAVGALVPEITPFFSAVVAGLLAKSPEDRFDSAAALSETLREGEESGFWRERAGAAADQPRVPVSRELALHGRERELNRLLECFRESSEGQGRTVLLSGEAGLGKSRIADALLREVSRSGAHLLYGSFPPRGGISGLTDAILAHLPPGPVEDALAARLSAPAGMIRSFAAFLRREAAPEGGEALHGDAVEALSRGFLLALAAERPTLIVIDDLHFAGPQARSLLLSLARSFTGARIMLLFTSRPGLPDAELAEFAVTPGFLRMELRRLSSDDIAGILVDAFGSEDLARQAGERIAAKSGGVPLFVAAMIGAMKDGGFLERREEDLWTTARPLSELKVPVAVRELVTARLVELSEEDRAVLSVCAVQGFEFDADLSAAALGVPLVRTLQRLAGMERRHGIVRSEGRRFRFDHQLIAEHLYEEMPERLREEYHRAIAGALSSQAGPGASGELAARIAHHWLRSNDPPAARDHLGPALAHLTASYQNESALEIAERALLAEVPAGDTERTEVLLEVAQICHLLGRRDREESAVDEARALAHRLPDPTLRARCHGAMGAWLHAIAENARAVPHLRAAVRLAQHAGESALRVASAGDLGSALLALGRYDDAERELRAATEVAVEIADLPAEHVARSGLGMLLVRTGRCRAAEAEFTRCLTICRRTGRRRAEGQALGRLAIAAWQRGRPDEARDGFERAVRMARETGDRQTEVSATGNLSLVLMSTARYGEAARVIRHFASLAGQIGDRSGVALALINRSQMLCLLGEMAAARECLREALPLAREIGFKRAEAQAVLCLAELRHEAGDYDGALAGIKEARGLLEDSGDRGGVAEALMTMGSLERDLGDPGEARRWFLEAVAIARELGRPVTFTLAEAALAALPGGRPEKALEAFAEHGAGTIPPQRMRALLDLHLATGDPGHLLAARELLVEAMGHAEEKSRRTMIDNVRLHREIEAAVLAAGLESVLSPRPPARSPAAPDG